MKLDGTTIVRTAAFGLIYELHVPFAVGSGGFHRWRREIVFAGPIDGQVIEAVAVLEQVDGVAAAWVHGTQVLSTDAMLAKLAKRRKKQPRPEMGRKLA